VADQVPTLQDLVKQTQEAQRRLALAQTDLAEMEVTGVAGGGLVTVIMRGDGEVTGVEFAPAVFDEADTESLGALTKTALRQATDAIKAATQEKLAAVSAAFGITPGTDRYQGH
jgi:DNA-binding YbaB/EbfC family protein